MTRAELLAGIRERHKALVKELADEAAANPKPKQSRRTCPWFEDGIKWFWELLHFIYVRVFTGHNCMGYV
jgi:hypothetical protein